MVKHPNIECKTKIVQNKRKLVYINKRTKKQFPIVVGKRGGLSIKTPTSKSRRYVKKTCKHAIVRPSFWEQVKNLQKLKTHKTHKKQ